MDNPFQDPLRFERHVPECVMVIFGANGDLTKRKLMPALYRLAYDRRLSTGFSVIGIPCNQFGGQEPGSAEEIESFCSTTYGVTFPMTEKVEVNGGGRHPLYQELTKVADAEGKDGDIRWNFEKFLVAADGSVARFSPKMEGQRWDQALPIQRK